MEPGFDLVFFFSFLVFWFFGLELDLVLMFAVFILFLLETVGLVWLVRGVASGFVINLFLKFSQNKNNNKTGDS